MEPSEREDRVRVAHGEELWKIVRWWSGVRVGCCGWEELRPMGSESGGQDRASVIS